jgi:hypothetical protein
MTDQTMKEEPNTTPPAPPSAFIIHDSSLLYPARLRQRLGADVPPQLTALDR